MAPSRETKAHCGACRAICLFATFFAILLSDFVSLVARAKVPPPTATIRAITEIARAGVGRLRSLLSMVGTPSPCAVGSLANPQGWYACRSVPPRDDG